MDMFWIGFFSGIGLLNLYIVDSAKVRYLRNPKVASSSIVQALYDAYPDELRTTPVALSNIDKSRTYTTFSVIRNKEDRLRSAYNFLMGREELPPWMTFYGFSLYVKAYPYQNKHWVPQEDLLKKVDIILKFKTLEEDFKEFCGEHGLKVKFPLPKLNRSKR